MATSLWVRVIRRHKIERQTVEPCAPEEVREALTEACRKLDLSAPVWLPRHERDWRDFSQTRFSPDDFMESVPFDRLEIELIDPDAPKKKSRDPRNA
ncbi:MAG: hypothetical protein IKP40_03365 [Clostridia bacterium]|nr:hypothetical protein [Clostridia bacterium]